jgi:threonine 3-dehydrogenase
MIRTLPDTMLAVKKLADAPGLDWCPEATVPELPTGHVLIAVTHAGICGTDRHIYEWDHWSQSRVKLGITIGHELCGQVIAVGPNVQRAEVGQRVSAEGHIGCGTCPNCRTGEAHICQSVDILGIDRNGCFAQFVAVPEENLWPVHPDIPDHIAAVFDPLGNAVHTVMSAGVSGRSVLITGVGIIGLMAVSVARAAGASQIVVTDTNTQRLELARELGADQTFQANDSQWPEKVSYLSHGQGPEILLEMSGHPQAIRDGFRALANGGTAALLGLPKEPISFDLPNDIIFKGAKVLGINGRRMFDTWYQMERFLLTGRLNLEPIITHQLELADFDRGFKMMQSGEAIKVVLKVPQEEKLCPTSTSSVEAGSY